MSANPLEPIRQTASAAHTVWRQTPCSIVMYYGAVPAAHTMAKMVTEAWHEPRLAFYGTSKTGPVIRKRPLRQRICRYMFREFFHACGLSPKHFHFLDNLGRWQMALISGALVAAVGLLFI